MPLLDEDVHSYDLVGSSYELPGDPFAYFACSDCQERMKVRASNLHHFFHPDTVRAVQAELEAKRIQNEEKK